MSKQAFDLIEEGLREALALVKGEERIADQKANLPDDAKSFRTSTRATANLKPFKWVNS